VLVWGRQDRTVPFSVSARVRQAMPRATFVPVDSAAHLPHLEQPDTVIGAVMRFLRGASEGPTPEALVLPDHAGMSARSDR
jgi:pimeloyl-ACP methyl ester carboxylesterase